MNLTDFEILKDEIEKLSHSIAVSFGMSVNGVVDNFHNAVINLSEPIKLLTIEETYNVTVRTVQAIFVVGFILLVLVINYTS